MKLKNIYLQKKVIINNITFDADINNESEYQWFFDNGFSHLFDVEDENQSKITIAEAKKKPRTKRYKGIENKDESRE